MNLSAFKEGRRAQKF